MCVTNNITKKPRFTIEVSETYAGYLDYFSGHGHAFSPDNLIACLGVSIPITYKETVKDIIDMLKDELGNADYTPVNEELFKRYEDEIRNIEDEEFINAFKNILLPNVKETDKFFDIEIEDENEDEDEYLYDSPYFLIYFHIYLEDED